MTALRCPIPACPWTKSSGERQTFDSVVMAFEQHLKNDHHEVHYDRRYRILYDTLKAVGFIEGSPQPQPNWSRLRRLREREGRL